MLGAPTPVSVWCSWKRRTSSAVAVSGERPMKAENVLTCRIGYFRAKMAQEKLIKASKIPYTIARSTQFFEFVSGIAQSGKGYDTGDFVMELRELGAVPQVAQHTTGRRSAIDRRTTRHPGYRQSQQARHRIEEVFAWVKTIAGQSKTKHRGLDRVRWHFTSPPRPTT
jgi:hypothetical protein